MSDRIEVENVNTPGRTSHVRRDKYEAMRKALLQALPDSPPGLPVKDVLDALKPTLLDALFPGGSTSGWWQKTVQLDLEAKGAVGRTPGRPMRIYKNVRPKLHTHGSAKDEL